MRLSFKKTNMKKLLLISSLAAVLTGCSTNAITGRKQLSLFSRKHFTGTGAYAIQGIFRRK